MIIFGFDPGLNGACTIYNSGSNEVLESFNFPTYQDKDNKKHLDCRLLFLRIKQAIDRFGLPGQMAVIEKVHAMPATLSPAGKPLQGISSTFQFGHNYGIINCTVNILFSNVKYVRPVDWKRKLGLLKQPKNASKALLLDSVPNAFQHIKRIDQADAGCIALYGSKYLL